MEVLGYADRFSARPGEPIRFMVSCLRERYRAEVVRLDRSWVTPRPEGWSPSIVPTAIDGEHPGREQPIHAGSYVTIPNAPTRAFAGGLTLVAWLRATLPVRGREQGIVAQWSPERDAGFALLLDGEGRLSWRIGGEDGIAELHGAEPLKSDRWYAVAATWDAARAEARLSWRDLPRGWVAGTTAGTATGPARLAPAETPLLLGAAYLEGSQAAGRANGKIDRPRLWDRALTPGEIEALWDGTDPTLTAGLVAAWDPVQEVASRRLVATTSNAWDGRLVNLPTRGVTGANWSGRDTSFHTVPAEYGAIHFHEDDLEDAAWEVDLTLDLPAEIRPGVYALRLTAGETVDHVPFYVRAARGANPSILYLASTNTYLAYGNEKLFRFVDTDPEMIAKWTDHEVTLSATDEYLRAHPELGASCYDLQADGSGTKYSTRLRPLLTMRPDFVSWMTGEPRHFAGDLFLVEWLERLGFAYDVATDEDLHVDGLDALAPYKVVVTGGHPEYWTAPMIAAIERYLAGGGRLMYLGGNGFYWVTGMDAAYPHVIEIRRGYNGTRSWESAPGEVYQTTSGEPGGLWRYRGRNPNKLTGIGFAAQGWGGAEGYVRLPASADPRASWIFEGVGEAEIIGDFGLVMGGAAGDEIDRYDPKFGTPEETLRLATTEGRHTDYYQLVLEDTTFMLSGMGGREHPLVRADITMLEGPDGGAVFSVGSIAWSASLPVADFANNVSRVTANVLRRFSEG